MPKEIRTRRKSATKTPSKALIQAVQRSMAMDVEPSFYSSSRRKLARETGFVDLAAATLPANTTGSISLVATIANGTSVNQRVGKKVVLKSIQMKGFLNSDSTTTLTQARWLLVYDRKPAAALPAITAILDTISPNSFNNDANSGRFQILRTKQYGLVGNSATPVADSGMHVIDEYVKVNKPAVYAAAGTGAIGDIETGAVYLVTCGVTAAGTADANFSLGCRTRFLDV